MGKRRQDLPILTLKKLICKRTQNYVADTVKRKQFMNILYTSERRPQTRIIHWQERGQQRPAIWPYTSKYSFKTHRRTAEDTEKSMDMDNSGEERDDIVPQACQKMVTIATKI